MLDIAIILLSAFMAGILNAIAGGGSFLTFPALVFVGVPPIAANATSAVAVFPGYMSSSLGFLDILKQQPKGFLMRYLVLSVIGGVAGALLLLTTPSSVFKAIVPWLLLLATLLFAFDKSLRRLTAAEDAEAEAHHPIASGVATLAVTTYGGYFNGGLGIILLALFSGLGMRDMNVMNGLKNALSFILSAASVATFALAGLVYWQEAILMMVAATIGGFVGAKLALRMPRGLVRGTVILVGCAMTAAFFWMM